MKLMNTRTTITTIILLALATVIIGCSADDPVAVETSDTSLVPSLAEVVAAVELDKSQSDVAEMALGNWRSAAAAQGPNGTNGPNGPNGHRFDFVATLAPELSTEELSTLVGFLVERRGQRQFDGVCDNQGGGQGHQGRGRRGGSQGFGGQGGPFAELGLTAEQMATMRALRMEVRTEMRALRVQFAAEEITLDEMIAQADEIRTAFQANLAEFLTADQLAAKEEWRDGHLAEMLQNRLSNLEAFVANKIERMTQMSSIDSATWGKRSLTSIPLSPYFLNLKGDPRAAPVFRSVRRFFEGSSLP